MVTNLALMLGDSARNRFGSIYVLSLMVAMGSKATVVVVFSFKHTFLENSANGDRHTF